MEKIENDKHYRELISIEMVYDEVHLDLHHNITPDEAIKRVSSEDTQSCFALTPEAAIQLANALVEAAYYSKVKRRERKKQKRK